MLMPLVTTTTYDIILVLREGAHGLVGSCIYKPHLFSAKSINRLLRDFRKVAGNYGGAAGAADFDDPRLTEEQALSP